MLSKNTLTKTAITIAIILTLALSLTLLSTPYSRIKKALEERAAAKSNWHYYHFIFIIYIHKLHYRTRRVFRFLPTAYERLRRIYLITLGR